MSSLPAIETWRSHTPASRGAPKRPPAGTAGDAWVVVLAAGEGSRLSAVTTGADGTAVPKQFCSVDGRRSLLRSTLDRAEALAPRLRIVTVVARQHERWWRPELSRLPARNVLVQPCARGTAAGLLLPLVSIARRDRNARVVVLPSDHHVAAEAVLARAIADAVSSSREHDGRIVVLGVEPDRADSGYGWIVPADADAGAGRSAPIVSFVEKPSEARARELLREGALWSSFMLAGSVAALLRAYERALPDLLRPFLAATGPGASEAGRDRVDELYAGIGSFDFSRDVLEACTGGTRVLRVPACGWSDLGTPERLAAVPGLSGPLVERARALLRSRGVRREPDAARRQLVS